MKCKDGRGSSFHETGQVSLVHVLLEPVPSFHAELVSMKSSFRDANISWKIIYSNGTAICVN